MRKICVVTGTRAEYGILSNLMKLIQFDENLILQVIVTNMHLSPEFGLTYREIESDGFKIDKKVEMLLSSDTPNGTVKSMGLATIGFADALEDLKPDLIVVLGDRYEMLSVAQAALIYKIPVAHLYGGEITEGAYDDSIRHAITKLSHLHFTSTEEYRRRVIQMGESPERVFCVGSLGVDNMMNEPIMALDELENSLDFNLTSKYILITFHPVTMETNTAQRQCEALLRGVEEISDRYKLLFTLPNSDTGGRVIISLIKDFVKSHPDKSIAIESLGKKRYYSALKYASAVVGNSSSGLAEAPAYHIPTLNIGNRQKGRTRSDSVVDCEASYDSIKMALTHTLSDKMREVARNAVNPYFKADTLQSVYRVIATYDFKDLIIKKFYNS